MLKHYVEEYYPGCIVAETVEKEIKTREGYVSDPKCFGYRFYDRYEDEFEDNGQTIKRYSENCNKSPNYYKGTVKTIEQIAQEKPGSILLRNMECNNWNRVLDTQYGQCVPLRDEDIVIGE
jgi:hypothetical protein